MQASHEGSNCKIASSLPITLLKFAGKSSYTTLLVDEAVNLSMSSTQSNFIMAARSRCSKRVKRERKKQIKDFKGKGGKKSQYAKPQ